MNTSNSCLRCIGRGWVAGATPFDQTETCPDCDGTGKVSAGTFTPAGLSFGQLETACCERQIEIDPEQKLTELFFGVELGGETGEALNWIKKIERDRLGIAMLDVSPTEARLALAKELADIVITAQNVALYYGISLGTIVRDKFNETSAKRGLKTKL